VVWTFNAIPDRAPTIALAKEPEPQLRGTLLLQYKLEDDYGVVDAQATFERKSPATDKPASTEAESKPPRPLFDAPNFTLVLPQARAPARARPPRIIRASLGRRRRGNDARRPRRGQQRRPLGGAGYVVAGAGRSGISGR
jgi:hypothetical protein